MAKFWTILGVHPLIMTSSLNPVTGWPSFGPRAIWRPANPDRLNPVTGWPSFGHIRIGTGVTFKKVLILLLDGQVLDISDDHWFTCTYRLNPVTGWPSFGLLVGDLLGEYYDVLILLLDGQVLDPEQYGGLRTQTVLILLLDGQVLDRQ